VVAEGKNGGNERRKENVSEVKVESETSIEERKSERHLAAVVVFVVVVIS
jgi:hypothetical protein